MKQPILLPPYDTHPVLSTWLKSFKVFCNDPQQLSENSLAHYSLPYLKNVVIDTSGVYRFTAVAVDPVTLHYIEKEVSIDNTIMSSSASATDSDTVIVLSTEQIHAVFSKPEHLPESFTSNSTERIYLSPCVADFFVSIDSWSDTDVRIAVNTPLRAILQGNKLSITADASNTSPYELPPVSEELGINSINGLKPSSGNINIVGIGSTVISVNQGDTDER